MPPSCSSTFGYVTHVTRECIRLRECDEQDWKIIYNRSTGILLSQSLGYTQLASRLVLSGCSGLAQVGYSFFCAALWQCAGPRN